MQVVQDISPPQEEPCRGGGAYHAFSQYWREPIFLEFIFSRFYYFRATSSHSYLSHVLCTLFSLGPPSWGKWTCLLYVATRTALLVPRHEDQDMHKN